MMSLKQKFLLNVEKQLAKLPDEMPVVSLEECSKYVVKPVTQPVNANWYQMSISRFLAPSFNAIHTIRASGATDHGVFLSDLVREQIPLYFNRKIVGVDSHDGHPVVEDARHGVRNDILTKSNNGRKLSFELEFAKRLNGENTSRRIENSTSQLSFISISWTKQAVDAMRENNCGLYTFTNKGKQFFLTKVSI